MRIMAAGLPFLLFLLIAASDAVAEKMAVIVNIDSPMTTLSERDVRDIYMGEKKFFSGVKLMPIHYAEGPVKDTFLSLVVRLTPKEYKLHWTKKIFQEGASAPAIERRSPDVIRAVAKEKGAIGYVPINDVSGTEERRIRIILEIGH